MQPISFDNDSYVLGGKRAFPISGEIHYFRVPREAWRDRLEKLKAAGGNCVATYVPWLLHEPSEGEFSFEGQLDVEAFLTLCNELGLWSIVRPGPYQCSELVCDGLPQWLVENYPDILARDLAGKPFRKASVSYLHPLFLEKCRSWYEAVIPRLARHQTTRGSSAAAFQFDNDLINIHECFGGLDYHPQTMGIGGETGRWPDFLKAKYDTPQEAGHAYGRAARSWGELRPGQDGSTLAGRRLMRDYQECYLEAIAEYAASLSGWMRELGVEVPLIHNSAGPAMNGCFERLHAKLGAGFLLGSAHSYNMGQHGAQNNPTPQYALNCFISLEQLRVLGGPASVFELPGSSNVDFPPITAGDASAAYLTNLAMGMRGWNYYIFAGGPNFGDTGATTDLYDGGAALSAASGETRPLYFVQRQLHQFLQRHPWLASARRVADFRVGFTFDQSRAAKLPAAPAMLLDPRAAHAALHNGLLKSAFCAGASPELVRLDQGELAIDLPLAVVSGDSMPKAAQERLVHFLTRGGRLLLIGIVPTLDEELRPCSLLASFVSASSQRKLDLVAARVNAAGIDNVLANGGLFAFESLPGGAHCIAAQTRGQRQILGFRRTTEGGGQVTVLGYTWAHAMREHEAMLRGLLTDMGWTPAAGSGNPNVWCALWRHDEHSILFLMNLLTASAEVRPVAGGQTASAAHTIPPMSVRVWQVEALVDPLLGSHG
jgi:beta-galactosidase